MNANNQLSHSEYVLFELSRVTDEIREIGNQFNLLEIDNIEKAVKRLKETVRSHKKPASDVFTVTI